VITKGNNVSKNGPFNAVTIAERLDKHDKRWDTFAQALADSSGTDLNVLEAVIRARLREEVMDECQKMVEEGYEDAYKMLKDEQEKCKKALEEVAALYDDEDKRFKQMREFMVDKIDQFIEAHFQRIIEENMTGEEVFKEAMGKKYRTIDDAWTPLQKEEFMQNRDKILQKMREQVATAADPPPPGNWPMASIP
jgi:translation elongation factor EF-G